MAPSYSRLEMMVVAASRLLRNGERVLVGTGIPLVAAILAKKTHAADMVMVMEAVAFDSNPEALPFCVADPRAVYRTTWTPTSAEVMGHFLQSGKIDVGFLGGAQVDRYGNLNSTCIGPYHRPEKRFEGSGGASDIASLAKRTIIIMNHEKRRFVEQVDYITSPGWKCRGLDWRSDTMRADVGLDGGPFAVVSTLGVMGFDEKSREMYVDTFYDDLGVSIADISRVTEFEIDVSRGRPMVPPTPEELAVLRERVDPEGIFMRY